MALTAVEQANELRAWGARFVIASAKQSIEPRMRNALLSSESSWRKPGPITADVFDERDWSSDTAQQLTFVGMGPGLRRDDCEYVAASVPSSHWFNFSSTSSWRKPGPMATGFCCRNKAVDQHAETIAAAAYGSRIGARLLACPGRRRSSCARCHSQFNFHISTLYSSSPGLTGRSSIPETAAIEPRSRGVLDAPPSRGDDSKCVALALPFPNIASHSRGMMCPRFS